MSKSAIGKYAKIRRGASPRPISDPKYFGGDVGWVRISDITSSKKFLTKTEQFVSKLGESLSVRVNSGDLIMSICATIGKPIIVSMNACIHDGFVQFYNLNGIDTEFLYYSLQYSEAKLIAQGQPGTQVNLNTNIVSKHEIFVPDLPTQKRIAKILSTVDGQIEKTEAIIAKYQAIKQGMLHDLFIRGIDLTTGKLRPTPEQSPELYKQSLLGLIPKDWDIELLKNVTINIGDGLHTTPKYTEGTEYYFINGNNLSNNKISLNRNTNTVSEIEYNKYKIQLNENTILMSINGTIGNLAFYSNEKIVLGKSAAYINCNHNLAARDFIFYQLQSYKLQKYFNDELTGSTIKNLSLKSIRFAPIVYTKNNDEQNIITFKLKSIEQLILREHSKLKKLEHLKQGLMYKLLNGDV